MILDGEKYARKKLPHTLVKSRMETRAIGKSWKKIKAVSPLFEDYSKVPIKHVDHH